MSQFYWSPSWTLMVQTLPFRNRQQSLWSHLSSNGRVKGYHISKNLYSISFTFKWIVQHFLIPPQQNRFKSLTPALSAWCAYEIWILRQLLLNWCGRLTILHFKGKDLWQGELWYFFRCCNGFIIWIDQFALLSFCWVMYACKLFKTNYCKWKQEMELRKWKITIILIIRHKTIMEKRKKLFKRDRILIVCQCSWSLFLEINIWIVIQLKHPTI